MSTPPADADVAVVGGGIIGLAVARALASGPDALDVCVLERDSAVGRQQTGHNSGVVHAGVYYKPGSLKARLCVQGARALYDYCEQHGIPVEGCGKLIVARDASELGALDELERRGHANGVPGLRRLAAAEIADVEPHCRGAAALHSPNTGIVDYSAAAAALARNVVGLGGRVTTGAEVVGLEANSGGIAVRHGGEETRARFAICCAGGWSDRLAVMAGAPADPRIVPFRGAYLRLAPEKRGLVRGMIYPVPDPDLPFLGVHLTRHIDGEVSLGPTALLAPGREAYRLRDVNLADLAATASWPGSWRMARRWWRTGASEIRGALSRRSIARAAADYVPELEPSDFSAYFAGVRAQAVGRDGALVDDFVIHETPNALHVRNAPSPSATSALAIADMLAQRTRAAMAV